MRIHSAVAVLLAFPALLLPGCGSSSKPTKPGPVSRSVTVALHDSLGAPMAGVSISVMTLATESEFFSQQTDAQGRASFQLPEGEASAALDPQPGEPADSTLAAGGLFFVPGSSRPAGDTVLVRLTAHTGSVISGIAHRPGTNDHRDIIVVPIDYAAIALVFTDSTGSYRLHRLPAGDWQIVYADLAVAQLASQIIPVPAQATEITAPTITLGSIGPQPAAVRSRLGRLRSKGH